VPLASGVDALDGETAGEHASTVRDRRETRRFHPIALPIIPKGKY
jgi:hypothetical protein